MSPDGQYHKLNWPDDVVPLWAADVQSRNDIADEKNALAKWIRDRC